MDDLQSQITEETAAIIDFLEQRLGRRSRWNGEIKLSPASDNYGKALWNGSISLDRHLAQTDLRWRTMIHEAFHHFSAGLTPTTYFDLLGWEEGVVEQLQRLLRSEILFSLGISLSPSIFAVIEVDHEFNPYIQALESLRFVLRKPQIDFYHSLLATRLDERPASVIVSARSLPPKDYRDFQRVFGLAFSRMRG